MTPRMSSDQNLGYLLYLGDYTQLYVGILMSHCKDPYEPISRMHCHKGFERCSNAPPSSNEAV